MASKFSKSIERLKVRLRVVWMILSKPNSTFVFLPLKLKDIEAMANDEKFIVDVTYHKFNDWLLCKLFRAVGDQISDEDILEQELKLDLDLDSINKYGSDR